jgi:lambda family phage tail tape measure protein
MAPAQGKTRANTAVTAPAGGKGDFGATPEATVRAIEASEKRIAQSRAEIDKAGQQQINADRLQAILVFASQREQIEARSSAQIKDIEIQRDADIAKSRAEIYNQERLNDTQKAAEFAAKRQEIETKAALDTAKARTQLQEQLIREDQRIQDIIKSSKDLISSEETRLELERQRMDLANIMLTATDRERKNAEDLLNIEVERLAKLQEIQRIKDLPETERLAREQEINKIYDTRKKRTLEQQEIDLQASQNFGAGYQKAFNQYIEDATNAFTQGQQVFGSVTRNMESALDQFVETGKLNFGDFAKSLIMDIIKIELRAQAAQNLKLLMGGSGSGSFLGSLFSGLFGGGKAAGGPVSNSKAYLVGEQGPELFVPNTAGSIVPNNQMGGAGGYAQVTYNINAVDASSFRSLVAQDPEFMFAVTEQGRKRMPNSRR